MRIKSSVTSISWIPSEAISGMATKMPFEAGVAHYDDPPPDVIDDLDALQRDGRFRFANRLEAWIEVEGDRIVGHGQSGGGLICSTLLRIGKKQAVFEAIALPDLQPDPQVDKGSVTFFQTAGGRTGVPAPRRVRRAPFVQFAAPLAWTTLALTVRADGSSSFAMSGASSFPRHWVYGDDNKLALKSGMIDFSNWYRRAFGKHSPWGDQDSEAFTTEVESALERQLSLSLMRGGAKPKVRNVKRGAVITEQGAAEDDIYLVLDGVVRIEVDGERLAEYGPGSMHGERAVLEGGKRTSTIRAVTACKLAVASADGVDRDALVELSSGHRREENRGS
ncbi:MAG TPA: cyclic nucleotide-binding domain-containing protein [Acidimicrobiales bacterium]|nr:cyclic nucleotide-binding domain-containing protein [Acidimicrobiales bacterium]